MNQIQRRFFYTAVLLLCACSSLQSAVLEDNSSYAAPASLLTQYATLPAASGGSGLSRTGNFTSNLGGFNIVIVPNASLASNIPALNAFNRAAAQWEARISDPITVTINAELATLGSGIIGSASSVVLQGSYSEIRNQLVANSAAEADDAIVASLPTAGTFGANLPAGYTLSGSLIGSKANLKAMGFTGLDGIFGASDATITFSSAFAFDYDNSDGVTAGTMDFETVAAHEIGHALGFFSSVDDLDKAIANNITGAVSPTTLDLYRFIDSANTALDPNNAATFATATRDLVPGAVGVTDFGDNTWGIGTEFRMSTGLTQGDGRQASHWKDDLGIAANYIGIMDPTLSFGTVQQITEADFRALDLIGYDIVPIPEPGTYGLGAVGLAALYLLRRKRVASNVVD